MQLTSAECRRQEAIQSDRAQSEPLDNVRNVALRAAIAWGHEATFLERQEARKRRERLIAELAQVVDDGREVTHDCDDGSSPAR